MKKLLASFLLLAFASLPAMAGTVYVPLVVDQELGNNLLTTEIRVTNNAQTVKGFSYLVLPSFTAGTRPSDDLLALDQALSSLAEKDPRKARVLELRLFGGLTIDETCKAMDLSHASVERDLKTAKAWVMQRLKSKPPTA